MIPTMLFRRESLRAASPRRAVRFTAALGALLLLCACASPASNPGGPDTIQSAFNLDDPIVDGVDIGRLTDAPLRKAVVMQFDRPVNEVFDFLLRDVDVYSDDIMAVSFDNTGSAVPGEVALGSARICTMNNGKTLVEPLVAYAEDRHYAYTTDAERSTLDLPVEDVLLFYTFEEKGTESTLVTVRAHYTPGVFLPMRPVVNALFKRNIDKTFAGAIETLGGRLVRAGN